MEEQRKRAIAKKISIEELQSGIFTKGEGWDPSYITTKSGEKVSRVNIIGVVISKNQENYTSISIEDGTGNTETRAFDDECNNIQVGMVVNIIGRPREYNGQRHLVIEACKEVNKKWCEVRKLENQLKKTQKKENEEIINEEKIQVNDPTEKILEYIKKKDEGQGVAVEHIMTEVNIKEGDGIIEKLIENGEIFEIKKGCVKILD